MEEVRYAIVDKTGNVINTVMAPSGFTDPEGNLTYASDTACIGWLTSDAGQTFKAPPVSAPAPTTTSLTTADLLAFASAQQNTVLSQVWTINVGTSSSPLLLTTKLDDAGQNAMLKLAMWGQLNASTGATEAYSNVDYTGATLTSPQATLMAIKTGGVVSQTYVILNSLAAQITAGTITTTAEIVSAGWPDCSVSR